MNFPKNVPWYDFLCINPETTNKLPANDVNAYFEKSQKIYLNFIRNNPIDEISESISEKGTLKDKFASFKVSAQETPLFSLENLKTINNLMSGKPRIQLDAMHCGVAVYAKYILPHNRKLIKFDSHSFNKVTDRQLLLFYFEDRVKFYYSEFLKKLEMAAKASQDFLRDPAIRSLGDLIRDCPENEFIILNILVDKFGDHLVHVSNIAGTTILSLLKIHPNMNAEITKIIKDRMKFFKEASKKRALKFLGQLKVGNHDSGAASEMLGTIVDQLIPLMKNPTKDNNKTVNSLMKGAERCAEVCSVEEMNQLIDPLYIFIAGSPLAHSLPALRLLYSIHKSAGHIPPKFYQFFFAFFNSADFGSSTKYPQLLNFLLQVLENEEDSRISCSFIHRLLNIGLHMNLAFTFSVLYFVSHLFSKKPKLMSMIQSENRDLELQYNYSMESPINESSTVTFPWILSLYNKHYHPSIRSLSSTLFKGMTIQYSGDPFADFAISKQLTRIAGIGSSSEDHEILNDCFLDYDSIPDFDDNNESDDDE